MRKEYDFSKSKKNPYTKKLKKQITIKIDEDTIAYFKKMAEETGISLHIPVKPATHSGAKFTTIKNFSVSKFTIF